MNKEEAYVTLQAEWVKLFDVRVGDKVRILREHADYELGSRGIFHTKRELDLHGREGTIEVIHKNNIGIAVLHQWVFIVAFHQIEITDQPRNTEIEVRYFKGGEDVTDKLSDESKRNLAK